MTLPAITVVGSLGSDPELRYTSGGVPVVTLNVAVNDSKLNRQTNEWEDSETQWYRATCWRDLGQNAAGSLAKGSRVIVTGRLRQRSFETKEGEKRTVIELDVDEIGPSLRFATATVTKTTRGQSGDVAGQWATQQEQQWAPSAPANDETPF